jgi:DNA-binding SARP family transcriptional activator
MTPEEAMQYALTQVQEPTSTPVTGSAPQQEKSPLGLRISALGGAGVDVAGHTLTSSDFGYAKPRELLFYLLSHPPRTREQIGLALWPEASASQLRGSFHEALRRLRKALGGSRWIVHENKRYSFNPSLKGHYFFFDVEAFEEKLTEAERAKEESPSEAIRHLKEAVGLYGGDFLEGFAAEGEWALVRQEELRRSYQDALFSLGGLLYGEGSYSEAAEFYRKVIAIDRYSEAAHRELMRSEAASGERGRALRHYRELVELLREELGSSPAPETVGLYEGLLGGDEV